MREIHYMKLCIISPNKENMDYNSSLHGPSLTRYLGGEWGCVCGGGGLYIYIFMFTCGKNNRFQKKSLEQKTTM